MKILHSYWSLPGRASSGNRQAGGWATRIYYYMSWTLSCLQFRKYYDKVELVTDSWGKRLLYDNLGLPYTNVSTALDELEGTPTDLWTMGKFKAYELQQEPFIHADGDVFIFKPFPEDFIASPILAQHLEVDYPYYKGILKQVQQVFTSIPDYMKKDWEQNGLHANAYNAGVVGGQDLDFIKYYTREALKFIKDNRQHLPEVYVRELNILYEQYLLYCLTAYQGREVNCYLPPVSYRHEGLTDFAGIPGRSTYVHPVAVFKREKRNCEQLAFLLRRYYPAYYYKILHLAKEHLI